MIGTRVVYEGIAVNNACGVIAKTNFAENSLQVCEGAWNAALSVTCHNNMYVMLDNAENMLLIS